MTTLVERVEKISASMGELFDFVANNEATGREFEEYMAKNNVEARTQTQLCDVLTGWLLDERKEKITQALGDNEISKALSDSLCSVFEIKKIEKNAFFAHCLTNEKDYTLLPLVKMTHLRSVCRGDFMRARIIKAGGEYFVLEIFDCKGAIRAYSARQDAVRYIIQNPACTHWDNDEKHNELKASAKFFAEKFKEYFGKSVISTTNKRVDALLEYFNLYCQSGEKKDYSALIEEPPEYKYFDLEMLDDDLLQSAVEGFSRHERIYDVALYCDKDFGVFVIPFYETAIREGEEKEQVLKKHIKSTFSPTTALFNSKTFSEMMGYKEEESSQNAVVAGRNDPCPCGSGKKYKKCCINRA